MKAKFTSLVLCLLGALVLTAGCGSSHDENLDPIPNGGTIIVEFDRNANGTSPLDRALSYTVQVVEPITFRRVRSDVTVNADVNETRQTILIGGVRDGVHDVYIISHAQENGEGTELGQYRALDVEIYAGSTVTVGGSTYPLERVTQDNLVPEDRE